MTSRSTRQALNRVLSQELQRSPTNLLLGETMRGIGAAGVVVGLYEQFGPRQVIETPVSENGFFGAALGLALGGMVPIVEIYSADFLLAVANEVMNDIAKWRWQQGRAGALPITVRGCMGANGGLGTEHSQCMESFLHHAPGLKIVVPGTPLDAAGLLRASIRDPDPVVFLEHRKVYDLTAEVPDDPDFEIPIGSAEVVRHGEDVTIVAWAWMRGVAVDAAESLEREGISAEIIDPRTIRPFDWDTVLSSVERTGVLVVAEESQRTGNVGAEIVARALEGSSSGIRAARVCMPDLMHPYRADMEMEILPSADWIVDAVRKLYGKPRIEAV